MGTPRLAVLSQIHLLDEALDCLRERFGELDLPDSPADRDSDGAVDLDTLLTRAGDAELALVGVNTVVPAEFFEQTPALTYLGLCGTSTAKIDVDAADTAGVSVTNVVDYGDEPAAEFAFMQLTGLLRGVGPYQWRTDPHEVMGRKATIVGMGALGASFARLMLAYKMCGRYFSTRRKPDWEARGLAYAPMPQALDGAEVVFLTGPTDVVVLGQDEFAALGDGAVIVQASVGTVIDDAAFRDWIVRPGNFAIFDYAAEELYDGYHTLPRVIFPKVNAGRSIETRRRLGAGVLANLDAHLAGHPAGR